MKFSFIVPSYNQGRFLGDALNSIGKNLCVGDELIVLDGGSTDGTIEVIKKYEKIITWWVSERDGGQAAAVNKGIARSTGDVIVWINSDDAIASGARSEIENVFRSDSSIDAAAFTAIWINETRSDASYYESPRRLSPFDFCDGASPLNQPSFVFKRELFDRVGALDESLHYALDFEFFARILRSGAKVATNYTPVGINRIHGDTKTASGRVQAECHDVARGLFGSAARKYPRSFTAKYGIGILLRYRLRFLIAVACSKFAAKTKLPGACATHKFATILRETFSNDTQCNKCIGL